MTTRPGPQVVAAFLALFAVVAPGCQPAAPSRQPLPPPLVMIPVANDEPQARTSGCPEGMILLPGGAFTMGADETYGDSDERPAHEVELSAYCLDRTEVTVARYRACTDRVGSAPQCAVIAPGEDFKFFDAQQLRYYDPFCNAGRTDREQHPVNCVDWNQASAFCRWAGGRLPTEAEWEYAARGRDKRRYPWGDEPPGPTLLNGCGVECQASQGAAGIHGVDKMFEGDDGFVATAPVGSFPAGASPFGVQDLLGNVWEWTADWKGPYSAERARNPHGPEEGSPTERVIRGISSWGGEHAEYGLTARGGHVPTVRLSVGGFRCARSLDLE
ncbi:MAG: SUMF1/EgtB/PvdO family nonheme iron enzyme [Byssovorax sp.]